MKKKLLNLILATAVLTAVITIYSQTGVHATTTPTGSQAPIVINNGATNQDEGQLSEMSMRLDVPKSKALIGSDEAVSAASSYAPGPAHDAKKVIVEYHALTDPNYTLFSDAAKQKNPDLSKNGLNQTPVYIVSFEGINIHGRTPTAPLMHEYNVVVDAKTGEVLLGYMYR